MNIFALFEARVREAVAALTRAGQLPEGLDLARVVVEPRAVLRVVDPKNTEQLKNYGDWGRVELTTLTKEFFVPGFLERDEGEREPPCDRFAWDGISGVRPFRGFAQTTTVGVY